MERKIVGLQGRRVRDDFGSGEGSAISGVANLPSEIIFNILSRLPIESLLRFRSACKLWATLIYDPYFLELQSKACENRLILVTLRSTQACESDLFLVDEAKKARKIPMEDIKSTLEHLEFVGSCNGFLCMASRLPADGVFICNPIMGECMALPGTDPDFDYFDHAVGFGFNSLTQEYKVVRFYSRYVDEDDSETISEIFTLGTESWSEFDFPFLRSFHHISTIVLFVGGNLHWIIYSDDDEGPLRVLLFGIEDEKFRTLPLPPTANKNFHLQDLAGRLALVNYEFGCKMLNIWLLMDKEKGIWIRLHAVDMNFEWNDFLYVRLLGLSQKFGLVLVGHNWTQRHLILFNHGSNKMEFVHVSGIRSEFLAGLFVPTLISLRTICSGL